MNDGGAAARNGTVSAEPDTRMLDPDEDLEQADYGEAAKPCDVVMKGGVTSGVVYPNAVCKLARRFYFCNLGGTSAGAIAASLAAAAELSRRGGGDGFRKLAGLPRWLGTGSNLIDLFQPSRATKPLFRVLLGAIGSKLLVVRSAHIVGNLAAAYAPLAIGVFAATIALSLPVVLALWGRPAGWYAAAVALVLAAALTAVALAARLFVAVRYDIANNFYGICTGSEQTKATPPLTAWLDAQLSEYAGIEGVLTFGDLWTARAARGQTLSAYARTGVALLDDDAQCAARSINLEMVTTNLTAGRPHTLPFSELEINRYYYDPVELRQFFPERVLEKLAAASDELMDERRDGGPLLPQSYGSRRVVPLPDAGQLPIVFAARLSLSFPLLFSAVPLYAVERKLAGTPGAPVVKHWFSDGGLSSNLPIHFFDTPLPRWPTFGLNLRRPVADGRGATGARRTEASFVAMASEHPPDSNVFPNRGGARIVKFLLALFDTLQNWTDNTQLTMPGYRERVVEVQLDDDEGGLNLDMDPRVRTKLSGRGALAGIELLRHYGGPSSVAAPMWSSHRFLRFFSTMAVAEMWLRHFHRGYDHPQDPDRPYAELMCNAPSSPWRFKSEAQGTNVRTLAQSLDLLGARAADCPAADSAANDPPEPGPELRARPRT